MRNIINVPQSRSARLLRDSQVSALFTSGFSTCNIVIGISEENDKAILIHVDMSVFSMTDQLKDEISWIGKNSRWFSLFRKGHGNVVLRLLLNFFNEESIKLHIKTIENKDDGIFLSFEGLHENALMIDDGEEYFGSLPAGDLPACLTCHPDEQLFLSVSKIEQIIGLKSRVKTGACPQKTLSIFDGCYWLLIPAAERELQVYDELVQEEVQFCSQAGNFVELASCLNALLKHIKSAIPQLRSVTTDKDMMMSIAPWYEGYLHDFDKNRLLKVNLLDLSQGMRKLEISYGSQEDKATYKTFLKLLNEDEEILFQMIEELMQTYQAAPDTEYKEHFLSELDTFTRHYRERKFYSDQADLHDEILRHAGEALSADVNMNMLMPDNPSQRFVNAFNSACIHTTKDNVLLSELAFKAANAFSSSGELDKAKLYYQKVYELEALYRPDSDLINDEALAQCCDRAVLAEVDEGGLQVTSGGC